MITALQSLLRGTAPKILVVGDLMLDRYAWGSSTRQSPEAPVPVFDVEREESRPGGAANVAANLIGLGAEVVVIGAVGDDADGLLLIESLKNLGCGIDGIQRCLGRKTTVKTRVIGADGHLIRLDREEHTPWKMPSIPTLEGFDAVILQDYNKGVLHSENIEVLIAAAQKAGVPVAVDPKEKNFFDYAGATLFKPNRAELGKALGKPLDIHQPDFKADITAARGRLQCDHLLVTLSEQGVLMSSDRVWSHFPADFDHIVDVSGAGDTVMAVAVMGLVKGWSLDEIAQVSSYCGGWTCQFKGVVWPDIPKILETLSSTNRTT
ncbi:MAG: hypothetical protein RL754_147 [Bacteroidota bacterium]|jgi:rfaE bifunctional protein kinase chain/domain